MATKNNKQKNGGIAGVFPISMIANSLLLLIVSIIAYLILGSVLAWAAGVVNKILPFLSILFLAIELYVLVGIVLSFLRFFRKI